jgi:hypothetical protein
MPPPCTASALYFSLPCRGLSGDSGHYFATSNVGAGLAHYVTERQSIVFNVQTSHGAPALMDAIRALLRAALAAPHNQQFLLLSESEVSARA